MNLSIATVGEPFETDGAVPTLGRFGHEVGVAFDGENFAAVFEDQTRIHAVLVAPEGRVQNLDWLHFGLEGARQVYPSLAFGGGKYLATWSDLTDTEPVVQGRLFSPDGTLEGETFTIASNAIHSSVAFDGTHFLVAYRLVGDSPGVAYRRVSTSGADTGSEHSILGTGLSEPVIAHAGSLGLMVWRDSGDSSTAIRAARIGGDGEPLDSPPLTLEPSNSGAEQPAVAGADGKLLVAYRRDARIHARLVDANGVSDQLELSPADSEAGLPAVAASGDGFVVAWADSRDEQSIRGVRVSSAGAVVDAADRKLAEGKPRSLTSEPLSLSAGGERLLVGFIGEGVQGSVFSPELEIENGDFPLSAVPNAQGAHQVTWNGQSYAISWVDERNGRDIEDMDGRIVRIGPDGTRLDPSGLVVSGPGTFGMMQVAGKDGNFLVSTYEVEDQKVHVRAVTGSTPGASQVLTERRVGTTPSIAFGGSSYLAAYTVTILEDSPATYAVYGRPIAADGTPGAEFPVELGLVQPPGTYVFANGDDYVLASSLDRVTLRTITPAGELGEPVLLQEGKAFLSAASNGDLLLIASIDQETNRVSARFFTNGAFFGDSLPIAETSSGFLPAVAWDGETFLVVWDEDETRIPKARTVTPNGSVSPVRELANAECSGPSLASNGVGQFLLSCVNYREHYVRRIDSYFIGSDPAPSVPPTRPSGTGGTPANGGFGGEPTATAGRGGSAEPSANGGTTSAGQPGVGEAGESGIAPGGAGGRPSGAGGRRASAEASAGGSENATGGSAPSPAAKDAGGKKDDGGCSVGSRSADASPAWLGALLMLAFGLRRRRSWLEKLR